MRKILSSIMLIAVAAMASVSCQKEEAQAPVEPKSTTITLKADVVDTKTYITEDNAVLWGTGEYVQLYFNNGTDDPQFVKSNSDNADVWDESDEAMFSFDITYNPADSYTLGGVYPASVVADSNTDAKNYKVILPSTQNASSTSYDPAAFIMIMKPETILDADFDKDGHIAYFRRAVALNKITLTGVKEAINSVAITAEGKDLAGRRKFNLTTGAEGEIYYGQTSTITVNATYPAGDIDVWFTSWGAELVEGETLKVVLKSETKTYEKTIAARAEGIKFVEGGLNKLTIDMSSIEGATSAVALPFVEDFAAVTSGSNTTTNSSTVVTNAMMSQFSSYANATYQADGAVRIGRSGSLITKELDLSKDFHVIVSAKGWSASELLLTVTAGSQVNDIELTTFMAGDFVDYIINFDAIDNSEVVKFTTTSDNRCFIDKIQILEGYTELPSVLTAENPEIMAAAGGAGSFDYTLKNPKDGLELTVSEEADWITDVVAAEGTVTYTVEANDTEDPREAVITLTYGDLTETVTVSQKGQTAAGVAYYEKVTSAPAADWSGTYLMVYENSKKVLSAISTTSTKYGVGVDVEIENNCILASSVEESYQIVITKATVTPDAYVLAFAGSKLYWTSGNSLATNSTESANTNWTLSVSEGNVTIVNCKDNARVIKWNASSPRFACYTSGQQAIQLYKLVGGESGETPVEKTLESIDVAGAKTEYTVGDEFVKPTVTATYSDGSTEDVTASAEFTGYNMSAADTYTVTVSYSGKTTTYSITVSAAQGGGEDGGDTVEQTATFNFKQIYIDNGNTTTSNVTVGDITFVGEKGTGSTPARAWSDGLRLYAGCKVTFKAADGYVITSISGDTALEFTGSQQTVEFSGLTKKTISANIIVTYKAN